MKEHFKKLKIIRQILVLAIVFVDLVTFNPASLTEANDVTPAPLFLSKTVILQLLPILLFLFMTTQHG